MRQKIFISILFLLVGFSINAQSIRLTGFKNNLKRVEEEIIKSVVDTFEVFQIDLSSFSGNSEEKIENLQLTINGKYNWILQLEPNNLLSEDCILTSSTGSKSNKLTNSCFVYKGYVNDNTEDEVRLSVYGNIIEGFIEQGSTRYYIEPLADFTNKIDIENNLVLFKGSELEQKYEDFYDMIDIPIKEIPFSKSITTTDFSNTIRFLRIATDADYEFYQIHSTNTNSKILAVLNQIESSYTSTFNIKFRVVFQNYYSTSSDPYSYLFDSSQASSLLSQFRTYWNASRTTICRDVAQLYSGKSQSSGVYGIAYVSSIYQSSAYAFNAVKNRTLMHLTSAHEIGHNFGANDNPTDGNCGTSQSSVMCQGEKKDPPWFSDISKGEMTAFISNHDYLTNRTASYNTLICSSGANTYTVNNLPTNYSINWNKSTNMTSTSHSDAGYYATLYSTGNGSGWFEAVTVKSTGCDCGNISLDNVEVWSGTPALSYITGPSGAYTGVLCHFQAYPFSNSRAGATYYWDLSPYLGGGNYMTVRGDNVDITFAYPYSSYQIIACAVNACGYSSNAYWNISVSDYGKYFINPNPASSEVNVKVIIDESASLENSYEDIVYTISIYNMNGVLQNQIKKSGKEFSIPIRNLKEGKYIVNINDGKKSSSQVLIVKH